MHPSASAYLSLSLSENDHVTAGAQICENLRNGSASILQLVMGLGEWLTNKDPQMRSAGTKLLAEVVKGAPEILGPNHVDLFAEFLAARIADWQCIEAAVEGCLALVLRGKSNADRLTRQQLNGGSPPLPLEPMSPKDGIGMLEKFASTAQVTPLARSARQACLELWLVLLKNYGTLAVARGVDIIRATVSFVEEEKDPRCLLLVFNIIKATVQSFHAPGSDASWLHSDGHMLVEQLSCYFPVRFNPPKSDPHGITRLKLRDALESALGSSPFLAQWSLPLILDKLSSTHKPAKEDAMHALAVCCKSYGREALGPHLKRVWAVLRSETMAPAEPGVATLGEDMEVRQELAAAARTCLGLCCSSLGPSTLDSLVLSDASVAEELRRALSGSTRYKSGSMARLMTDRTVQCAAETIAAVASASPACCDAVCKLVLPWVIAALQKGSRSDQPTIQESGTASVASSVDGPEPEGPPQHPATTPQLDSQQNALLTIFKILSEVSRALAPNGGNGGSGGVDEVSQAAIGIAPGWRRCSLLREGLGGLCRELTLFMGTALHDDPGDTLERGDSDGDGGDDGVEDVVEAKLLCCRVWRGIVSILDLDLDPGQGSDLHGSQEGAQAGNGNLRTAIGDLSPGLLLDAARYLVHWALKARPVGSGEHSRGHLAEGIPSVTSALRMDWGREAKFQSEAVQAVASVCTASAALRGGCLLVEDVVWGELLTALEGTRGRGEFRKEAEDAVLGAEAESGAGHGVTAMDVDDGGLVDDSSGAAFGGLLQERAQVLAVSAYLSRHGPPALGWMIASRWRDDVLAGLMTTSRNGSQQQALARDLLSCLAFEILPWRPLNPSEHEAKESLSMAMAILEDLSVNPLVTFELAMAASACLGQLIQRLGPAQQIDIARAASPVILLAAFSPESLRQGAPSASLLAACAVIANIGPEAVTSAAASMGALDPPGALDCPQRGGTGLAPALAFIACRFITAPSSPSYPEGPISSPSMSIAKIQEVRREGSTLFQHAAGQAAATALGSLVNRSSLPADQSVRLISELLDGDLGLLARAAGVGDVRGSAASLRTLGHVGHALTMRGHPRAMEAADMALRVILLSRSKVPSEGDGSRDDDSAAQAALEMFSVLLYSSPQASLGSSGSPSAGSGSITPPSRHPQGQGAVVKVLWQQRTFVQCLHRILASIDQAKGMSKGDALHASAPAASPQLDSSLVKTLQMLSAALCTLISAAPAPIVGAEAAQVVPALVDALGAISGGDGGSGLSPAIASTLQSVLPGAVQFLRSFLCPTAGAPPAVGGGGAPSERTKLVSAHIGGLVAALTRLAMRSKAEKDKGKGMEVPGQSAATREAALGCLEALAQCPLPYHELHPYKEQVLSFASVALDDDKRRVRRAALACKRTWGAFQG